MKTSDKKAVHIVGAGISGLLCAYYAVEKGYEVDIYETASVAGGKINTLKNQHGLMETAANAILADATVEEVAEKIGLKIFEKKTTARKRYIYYLKKITRWPLSLSDSLRLAKFILQWKLKSQSVKPHEGESLKTWSDRQLSPAITKALLGPACQGIFGVDADLLSASLIFNYFFATNRKVYGRLRGSVAPEKGMGDWIHSLVAYLQAKNVRFHFSRSAPMESDKIYILATDLKNAVQILKSHGDARASLLEQVPCVDLVSVNAFYAKRPTQQNPGFGVLFARSEKLEPLGVLFNNDIFSQRTESCHSETWIFGSLQKNYSQQPDSFFHSKILAARHELWNDSESPVDHRLNRWPEAIPLYGVELERALQNLSQKNHSTQIYLMGNYLGEIGLNRLFHGAKSLLERIESDVMSTRG